MKDPSFRGVKKLKSRTRRVKRKGNPRVGKATSGVASNGTQLLHKVNADGHIVWASNFIYLLFDASGEQFIAM